MKPIIFSAPMVLALLDGRKTQTRRPLRLSKEKPRGAPVWEITTVGGNGVVDRRGNPIPETPALWDTRTGLTILPQYTVGDRLWVRETWKPGLTNDGHGCFGYRADMTYRCGRPVPEHYQKWRSPIYMPRKASRLTLTVTDVRVQRLQEISDEDIRAEGLVWAAAPRGASEGARKMYYPSPRASFAALWNSIHGPATCWDRNPWVVALTFTVERRNIDEVGA